MNTGGNVIPPPNRLSHNSRAGMKETDKVSPRNQNAQIPVDTVSPKNRNSQIPVDKPRRGRPGISPDEYPEILGRAEHYQMILNEIVRTDSKGKKWRLWDELEESLSKAKTKEEVALVVAVNTPPYHQEFAPLIPQIVKVIREKTFPKSPDAQLKFFVDSIAALGRVSPRRSRNICQKIRQEQRSGSHDRGLRTWIENLSFWRWPF